MTLKLFLKRADGNSSKLRMMKAKKPKETRKTKSLWLKKMKRSVNQVIVTSQKMMTMTTLRAQTLKVKKIYQKKDYLGRKWRSKQRKRIEELLLEDKVKIYHSQIKREDLQAEDE